MTRNVFGCVQELQSHRFFADETGVRANIGAFCIYVNKVSNATTVLVFVSNKLDTSELITDDKSSVLLVTSGVQLNGLVKCTTVDFTELNHHCFIWEVLSSPNNGEFFSN